MSRRIALLASVAVSTTLVTACMVGPDYRRPEFPVPKTYEYEPKDAADTVNTDWWRQFDDAVLDQLIVEALANNKSVKQAAANVEQAAALLTETQSQFYPQVGYDASGTRQQYTADVIPNRPGLSRKQTSYSVLASASWEIDLWGRIRRQTEAAQASLLGTDDARRGVILSLVGQVANNYLALRALDEQLQVAKKTLGTYEESLKLFQLQFQYGVVSQMTVAQAKSQYETAAAQIPAIEQEIVTTENAICVLLGRNPGRIARGKALVDMKLPQTPAGLPSQLLERRPDVAQSEQQLIAANAQIGAAKALY
ncbi:MAG: efflux transporter outer membrane subunit, partial [Burkholderiaceae bacterium]